jgi:hypothetical protein
MTMPSGSIYDNLTATFDPYRLVLRGGIHLKMDKSQTPQTLVLVGNIGSEMWGPFSREDTGLPNSLDHWTRQVVEPIAERFGAATYFAFEGPPYHPFQQWVMQAENVFQSPIGSLIHPKYGLWHAYRAALVLDEVLELPIQKSAANPCDSCEDKPCLSTCPISAFTSETYDVPSRVKYLKTSDGEACLTESCAARRACPVGIEFQYNEAQSKHHMGAFFKAQTGK